MRYYLAEYRYSANISIFDGDKLANSYRFKRLIADINGGVFVGRSGLIRLNENKQVFETLPAAVEFLLKKSNAKIERLQKEIAEISKEQNQLIEIANKERMNKP